MRSERHPLHSSEFSTDMLSKPFQTCCPLCVQSFSRHRKVLLRRSFPFHASAGGPDISLSQCGHQAHSSVVSSHHAPRDRTAWQHSQQELAWFLDPFIRQPHFSTASNLRDQLSTPRRCAVTHFACTAPRSLSSYADAHDPARPQ